MSTMVRTVSDIATYLFRNTCEDKGCPISPLYLTSRTRASDYYCKMTIHKFIYNHVKTKAIIYHNDEHPQISPKIDSCSFRFSYANGLFNNVSPMTSSWSYCPMMILVDVDTPTAISLLLRCHCCAQRSAFAQAPGTDSSCFATHDLGPQRSTGFVDFNRKSHV